ncbi:MAG: rhodanese-like domain-containing protein [Hansschlegelia sp.]
MPRRALFAAAALLAVVAAPMSFAATGGPGSAPEPEGLWMGAVPGYTPSTLKGAEVVTDVDRIAELAKAGAVLLDVAEPERKPASLPETAVWRPQHRSIPGAVWFPGSARGDLPAEREQLLKARVEALTGGDRSKPVVAFCHPDCWGSWNMGKRLVTWGYAKVSWFPRGIEAWQESDRPTAIVKPDAEWSAASKPDAAR